MPFALASCIFTPGAFESTLDIRADRSFTFTYKGEVLGLDLKGLVGKAMAEGLKQRAEAATEPDGKADTDSEMPDLTLSDEEKAKRDADFREMAALVAKEKGYRQVEYRGDGIFFVDYAITGKLGHGFVFPYNQDAQLIFPFVVIELRGADELRIKAPGYIKQGTNMGPLGDLGGMASGVNEGMSEAFGLTGKVELKGNFTLSTDAEIISQNSETRPASRPNGKAILWKLDTRSTSAPMAVLKVAGI